MADLHSVEGRVSCISRFWKGRRHIPALQKATSALATQQPTLGKFTLFECVILPVLRAYLVPKNTTTILRTPNRILLRNFFYNMQRFRQDANRRVQNMGMTIFVCAKLGNAGQVFTLKNTLLQWSTRPLCSEHMQGIKLPTR